MAEGQGVVGEQPPAKRPRTAEDVSSVASSVDPGPADVVAYPGEEGSLAHIAATKFFKSVPGAQLHGVNSFASVFQEVSSQRASYGVIPIENSASGTLHKTYDLLVEHEVCIGGELGVREVYCLCARPGGGGLAAVRRVLSHPNILDACSSFVETRLAAAVRGAAAADRASSGIETLATRSTTEAARRVAEDAEEAAGPGALAAIATKEAARRFGLAVIAEDIGNDAFLETRYILVHLRGGPPSGRAVPFPHEAVSPQRKRSACFALNNEPGSIFRLLSCWALRSLDILKVETRPLSAGHRAAQASSVRLWDYLFYVDYAVPPGHTPEENTRLWDALSEFSLWARDLGTYPSQITRAEKQAQTWADMVDIMTKA